MKQAILITLTAGLLLAGCDRSSTQKTDATAPANQKNPEELKKEAQINLLNDVSGVWSDRGSLVTIYYHDGLLQVVFEDRPILASIGDIDIENQTVNILVVKKADNEEAIITIRKKENPDGTGFGLVMTGFTSGMEGELTFVRKIGTDDKNRISKIYRKAQEKSDALAEQEAEEVARQQAIEEDSLSNTEEAEINVESVSSEEDHLSEIPEQSETTTAEAL